MTAPTTVTRLFLVRHGATAATEEDRFSGSTAAELSEEGRWQAARLGERLSRQHITAIYSSPLSRALDTARIVAGHCGLEPITRDGLREIGHGHWEGMKRDEVEREFGREYGAWEADPFTFAPAGGDGIKPVAGQHPFQSRDLFAAYLYMHEVSGMFFDIGFAFADHFSHGGTVLIMRRRSQFHQEFAAPGGVFQRYRDVHIRNDVFDNAFVGHHIRPLIGA